MPPRPVRVRTENLTVPSLCQSTGLWQPFCIAAHYYSYLCTPQPLQWLPVTTLITSHYYEVMILSISCYCCISTNQALNDYNRWRYCKILRSRRSEAFSPHTNTFYCPLLPQLLHLMITNPVSIRPVYTQIRPLWCCIPTQTARSFQLWPPTWSQLEIVFTREREIQPELELCLSCWDELNVLIVRKGSNYYD